MIDACMTTGITPRVMTINGPIGFRVMAILVMVMASNYWDVAHYRWAMGRAHLLAAFITLMTIMAAE